VADVAEQRLSLFQLARRINRATLGPDVLAHGEENRVFVVDDENVRHAVPRQVFEWWRTKPRRVFTAAGKQASCRCVTVGVTAGWLERRLRSLELGLWASSSWTPRSRAS